MYKNWTTESFIDESKNIHHNFYSYEKTIYKNKREKVIITCPKHGDFLQTPESHLNGHGCRLCNIEKKTFTNEEFIAKAKEKYGDKYTYEKTLYNGSRKDVIITCQKHGDFSINPYSFLNGRGCPYCSNFRISTDSMIEKFKEKYGDKYTYEKTLYKKATEKVIITCPIHGDFKKIPSKFLNGSECPKCKYEQIKLNKKQKIKSIKKNIKKPKTDKKKIISTKTKTTEQFIEEAKKVHDNKYDYSLVKYVNSQSKVKIICKKCGKIFEQSPASHLEGSRCPYCYGTPKKTTEQFIEEVVKIHPEYTIDKNFKYSSNRNKVNVTCSKCGNSFEQNISSILNGKVGCPYCSKRKKPTLEEFIEKAKKVHGKKYDYSKVKYINCDTKVEIVCPEHGSFWQTPYCHINAKHGCPTCMESTGEREVRVYLEEHDIKYVRQYKFEKCKNIFQLPFDFYLPDKNIVIEYQGIQHYKPVKFFGGEKHFSQQKSNDEIKREFCIENNIKEVEIKYCDNVENIMESI